MYKKLQLSSLALMIGLSLIARESCAQENPVAAKPKRWGRDYLDRKDFDRIWFNYTESGNALKSPWKLIDEPEISGGGPILVCSGTPDGYLRTTEILEEYSLSLDWRYPKDEYGNSGILLHVSDKDQVWPVSVQVQLHTPTAGSVFPTSGATTDKILNPPPDLKLKPQEWNRCQILSADGILRISINGRWVGDVAGCAPHRGHIALQSEGSEVHFRNLEIRPLSDEERREVLNSELARNRPRRRIRRRNQTQ